MKSRSFTAFMDKIMDFIGGTMFFMMVLLTGFNVISFWITGRRFGQLEELLSAAWYGYLISAWESIIERRIVFGQISF